MVILIAFLCSLIACCFTSGDYHVGFRKLLTDKANLELVLIAIDYQLDQSCQTFLFFCHSTTMNEKGKKKSTICHTESNDWTTHQKKKQHHNRDWSKEPKIYLTTPIINLDIILNWCLFYF